MSGSTSKSETTQLENTTYNILAASEEMQNFLYDTIGTYIRDAQKANNRFDRDVEHNKTR